MLSWNCVASYSETWKDAVTKGPVLLNTPASATLEGGVMVDLHTSDARLICMANAWATVVQDWLPEAAEPLLGLLQQFAYPDIQPGYDADVDACFDIDGDGAADRDCISTVAASKCFSPSVMGSIVGRQLTEFARRDGWNMYGELNRDGSTCTANCRRYTDPTGYNPVNVPGTSSSPVKTGNIRAGGRGRGGRGRASRGSRWWQRSSGTERRWQPLLEDNGSGYFTRQEHVTPHIGSMGKTAVLTREDFESRSVQDPCYDYDEEAMKVMDRLAQLDDRKKMLIEFFDNKIEVGFAVIGAVAAQGAPFETILNFSLGYTAAEYDAVLLAWKAKVETDLVRPTTWIQDQLGDMVFSTWAGPFQGNKLIKGINFESYIRVMPHSEFVSGSGCLCQAIYEHTDAWVNDNLGIADSIPVALPPFAVGSSKTEPGVTPSEEINVVLPNMLALRDACGTSRLDGGMHFEASVPASYELCAGVGIQAAEYVASLW